MEPVSSAAHTVEIRHLTAGIIAEREKKAVRKKYIFALALFLVLFWVLHDFILVGNKEFQISREFSFENKTSREIAESMTEESQRLVSIGDEKEQIIGFVHIIERNRYLLYKNEISLESFYDFITNILYPRQKISMKSKGQYAYQVRKYLNRMRKTRYEYLRYQLSDPEFYYEDYTRNARVNLVRTTLEGTKEYHRHYFRKYKGRYYLYLK
ncbi:MAG: hypothetical protein GY950_36395 [bacterium]|nr:hypothetical protein [bacterium]